MYANASGAENGSYSLTFLGKKVGRHHSVAPAGKQRECEAADHVGVRYQTTEAKKVRKVLKKQRKSKKG